MSFPSSIPLTSNSGAQGEQPRGSEELIPRAFEGNEMKRGCPELLALLWCLGPCRLLDTRTNTCPCTSSCYFQCESERLLGNTCSAIKLDSAQSSQWNLRMVAQSGARTKAKRAGMGVGGRWGTEGPEAQKRDVKLSGRQRTKVEHVTLE